MEYTRRDIERIYDELDRRMNADIKRGDIPADEQSIHNERITRLQGVYGTIMVTASDANWRDIVWWLDEIEAERYGLIKTMLIETEV